MIVKDIAIGQNWVPTSCTLPTTEQPIRVAEFDALFAEKVQTVERVDAQRLRLDLVFDASTAAQAAQLAAQENACCSFFTFTLTIADGSMALEVTTPQQQVAILDALQARASVAVRAVG
jgi:hypothetical protein